MGVSKNRGTPKWMVKIMENPFKMDDLGWKTHYFRETSIFVQKNPTKSWGHLGMQKSHPHPKVGELDAEQQRLKAEVHLRGGNGCFG